MLLLQSEAPKLLKPMGVVVQWSFVLVLSFIQLAVFAVMLGTGAGAATRLNLPPSEGEANLLTLGRGPLQRFPTKNKNLAFTFPCVCSNVAGRDEEAGQQKLERNGGKPEKQDKEGKRKERNHVGRSKNRVCNLLGR